MLFVYVTSFAPHCRVRTGFADWSTGLSKDVWRHMACTYDAANIKLYSDGVLGPSTSFSEALATTSGRVRIGAQGTTASGEYFTGNIDEVIVWLLSLQRRTQHYTETRTSCPFLVEPTTSLVRLTTCTEHPSSWGPPNIISTSQFSWNMRMIGRHARTRGSAGTEAGECGFRIRDHSCSLQPIWNGSVDGKPLSHTSAATHCRLYDKRDHTCIFWIFHGLAIVVSDCYRVKMFRATKARYQIRGARRQMVRGDHFNFGVAEVKKCPSHGILGQTSHFKHIVAPRGYDGEGVIEGTIEDYEVKSVFDTDFKYSLFIGS
eukprot:NODE_3596_length_1193_cov_53.199065_g3415_i0.p1 GENE.NODE_3596_length_1193_cov_53.199065_g3415_i0~~NODE_3596_length_1193_cov_53.199065_g3415_i0.p1  ORF type:complete len:317 (+),score=12.98 NODE_3596_length_1193_cov_53.199065_g3415_i0:106-1056(+)